MRLKSEKEYLKVSIIRKFVLTLQIENTVFYYSLF